jgi:hypothetical protein
LEKWTFEWTIVFFFAEVSAFFAGHIQTLFYALIISNVYLFLKVYLKAKKQKGPFFISYNKIYLPFLLVGISVYFVTAIQWIPTLQFILHSARDIDQNPFQNPGWFIPWQHLMQFIFPDFFGNPTTLNYWGVWNYAEFSGYIGILPLLFAITAMFFRRDKKTYFWTGLFIAGLLFALPTPLAQLPFLLHVPFLSTAQPTRLIAVIDFSLAILAALGLDMFHKKPRSIVIPSVFVGIFVAIGWGFAFIFYKLFPEVTLQQVAVTKHNLIFSTLIFCGGLSIIFFWNLLEKRTWKKLSFIFLTLLLIVSFYDVLRFAQKFTPFTTQAYLFPPTKTITFLQQHAGNYRIMETDSQILPPNFSVIYKMQSVDGYDPLYIKRYGVFIAAMQRNKPDLSSPFGFNRIITPQNIHSPLINLLGVKYVLSLKDIQSDQFKKVFQEGQTQVYENTQVFPRAFFVQKVQSVSTQQEAIEKMFSKNFDPEKQAIIEQCPAECNEASSFGRSFTFVQEDKIDYSPPVIFSYKSNSVSIKTDTNKEGFLLLTDSFYPTWHAFVDGKETPIFATDVTFRGVRVPAGKHIVVFQDELF